MDKEHKIPNTITLFLAPDKEKKSIDTIFIVNTKKIIKKLNLNNEKAIFLIKMNDELPRSFNAQASLTINDIKSLSEKIIIKHD